MIARALLGVALFAASCGSRAAAPPRAVPRNEPGSAAIVVDTLRGSYPCNGQTCGDGQLCREAECGHTCPPGYRDYSVVKEWSRCVAAPAACPHDGACACDGVAFCRVTGRVMHVMGF